jgi:hypothetical protein
MNAKVRRIPWRRLAVYASAVGIAVAGISAALTTLPSSASPVAASAIRASAIAPLKTAMMRLARLSNDAHPVWIRAVATTRADGLQEATPGDTIPGSGRQSAYLVVMKGNFRLDASVPSGAKLPTGRYLAVTISRSTFQVMDLGLSNRPPPHPLGRYGKVSNLLPLR